ncbi:hypothetical protein F5B22DRAFT_624001 [Xylaria bambusicola]|uniref:uncharacterized protein n=1 Tax=Xylaria bambusicola TaxID=326684 RepID=UPI002007B9BD|nr:uncharacterized protein F5B22DRAFT_624001 [Xylaria bambusicola]KAI0506371.1 hypothetical protein F5B22DRAFT_624001 [Xylaria bambusicola]
MATNIFRMFSPDSKKSKEDRVKKRKAQLRNAQLTYRERKERYTKALEENVAESRANEADLHRQIGELRETVQKLAQFILDQGVQIPDEIKLPADLNLVPEKAPAQEWPSQQDYQHTSGINNQTHSTLREDGPRTELISNSNSLLRLGDLDPLAVGMEFVLTLERPCVNHLYPPEDTAHEVGGHGLTVSGQLAPMYPKSVFESNRAHETFCREVPEQSLHSLLALSSELCPESEITPIEAWHSIRSQPLFGGMRAQNLWRLAERLRDEAICHGFGAVVKRESFEKFMFETLILDNAF